MSFLFFSSILLEKKKSFLCSEKTAFCSRGKNPCTLHLFISHEKKREIFLFQLERRNKFDDSRKVHQWKFSSDRSRLDKKNCVLTQIPRKRKTALLKKKIQQATTRKQCFFQKTGFLFPLPSINHASNASFFSSMSSFLCSLFLEWLFMGKGGIYSG